MTPSSPQVRAERLRVLLALHQGADSLGSEGCKEAFLAGLGPTVEDFDLIDSATEEDHQLGLACFAIEADLRRRAWEALERLAVLLPVADFDAALNELSAEQVVALVSAALTLGWRGPAPSEP